MSVAQYVTLVLDLADARGVPVSRGSAVIVPSAQVPDPLDQILVGIMPVAASFAGPPSPPSVRLISTDSIGPQPNGWLYTISFAGVPGLVAPFSFYLPAANGLTQYLSRLAPAAPQSPSIFFDLVGGSAVSVPIAVVAGGAAVANPGTVVSGGKA